jgi:hypothetical protein
MVLLYFQLVLDTFYAQVQKCGTATCFKIGIVCKCRKLPVGNEPLFCKDLHCVMPYNSSELLARSNTLNLGTLLLRTLLKWIGLSEV